MKSNSFFSFNRFSLLLKNDLLLNYKKYILTIVTFFLAGYIIIYTQFPDIVQFPSELDHFARHYKNAFLLLLVGLIPVLGLSFPTLNSKQSTQSYLMMPNSTFEKYFSQFFLRFFLGGTLFLLIFWIDAYLARATFFYFHEVPVDNVYDGYFRFSNLFSDSNNGDLMDYSAVIFFMTIGLFFLNVRVFFVKASFLKTSIIFTSVLFVLFMLFIGASYIFYPETTGIEMNLTRYNLYGRYSNIDIWMAVMCNFSWMFILPLGYFKLKEKEL